MYLEINKISNTKLRKLVNSQPSKVVVYLRVSTDKQEKSGLGLEGQKTLCKDVANRLGLEVVEIFQESISGKTHPEKRPVFMKALETAQRSGGRLMVAKLDRLSREVYHVSGYTQKHLFGDLTPDLLIAESPNMSQMEIYLKAMISEEERRMIGERTRAALAERKKQGVNLGETGRKVACNNARAKTTDAIAYAQELRAQGYSYQRIADALNEIGYKTSRGGQWYAANVRLRLKNN
ncbi:MAG: recombinase family protein [Cyanobacteria bacterium P01_A01_bin.83]